MGAFYDSSIQKCDPCLSGWKREEETGTLIPLWYDCNELSQSMSKRRRPSAHKRAQTQKTVVIDYDRRKRLSAAVAKINVELWDTDSDNENDTDSSNGLSNFGSECDSSDPDIYELQKQLLVGVIFLNGSKNFCKIPKKTFRKSSIFITASDFWPTALLK